ncbi:hypothetical protein FA13DRAFT_948168 [Coprinellus micaceus]|uniref:Uncharacterized protein n=1 Tax=Coprinellus micaceus TaxID=71717 RepID=A0A4Y7T1B4_COPMI|nr:hypothetical protein FA13DRAFT_948168 [Coprinellus micaceus]
MDNIDQEMGQPEMVSPLLPDVLSHASQPFPVQPLELSLDLSSAVPSGCFFQRVHPISEAGRAGHTDSVCIPGHRPWIFQARREASSSSTAFDMVIVQYCGGQIVVPRQKACGDAFSYKEFQRLILEECSLNGEGSDTSSIRLRMFTTELALARGEEVEISEAAWPGVFGAVKKVVVKERPGTPRQAPSKTVGQIWAWGETLKAKLTTDWQRHAIELPNLFTKFCLPVLGALQGLGAMASVIVATREIWESQGGAMVITIEGLLLLSVVVIASRLSGVV